MPARRSRTRRKLGSETMRLWWSAGAAVALAVIGMVIVILLRPQAVGTLEVSVSMAFLAWIGYCVAYPVLTWHALARVDAARLGELLQESEARRRRRQVTEMLVGSGGDTAVVVLSLIAVAAVVASASVPQLRGSPLVVALAVLVVAAAWHLIVITYALLYAREDVRRGGLRFPDATSGDLADFPDYYYFAVQVSTTFGTSDVSITARPMRRVVTSHSLTAFVFNTVIVALLVSSLVGVSR